MVNNTYNLPPGIPDPGNDCMQCGEQHEPDECPVTHCVTCGAACTPSPSGGPKECFVCTMRRAEDNCNDNG